MMHAAVDDAIVQPRLPPDIDVRQQHRVFERRIGMRAHAGEQQRIAHLGPRDDAVAGHQRGYRRPAPPVLVMDELRGGHDFGIGPDRPGAVVEVELRHKIGQVDIGLPEGVDGADVAPVGFLLKAGLHAAVGETVRDGFAVLDDVRNDVIAEIVAGIVVLAVLDEQAAQEGPVEDIDAHRGQRMVGVAGDRRRVFRFFQETP